MIFFPYQTARYLVGLFWMIIRRITKQMHCVDHPGPCTQDKSNFEVESSFSCGFSYKLLYLFLAFKKQKNRYYSQRNFIIQLASLSTNKTFSTRCGENSTNKSLIFFNTHLTVQNLKKTELYVLSLFPTTYFDQISPNLWPK